MASNRWTCAGDICLEDATTWTIANSHPERKVALCDRHLSMLERIFPHVETEPIENQGVLAGWRVIKAKKSLPGARFNPVKRRVGMEKRT